MLGIGQLQELSESNQLQMLLYAALGGLDMTDPIFLVDSVTQEPIKLGPASFSEIGIKEREDLEQWIINHSEMLWRKAPDNNFRIRQI